MIELVLIFCLSAQPGQCREQRPMPEQPLSLMGCLIAAPQIGAAWVATHPTWRLASWRCGSPRPGDRPA